MSKLRIVHVGCGSISDSWFSVLKGRKDIELVALVDIDRDNANEKKAKYGFQCEVYTDYQLAINELKPDVVIDNTIPKMHHLISTYALDNNCDVLTEKPLADTIEHALLVKKKAKETKKNVIVMQNRRYLSKLHGLKSIIDNQNVGDIDSVHASFFTEAHFGGFRDRMSNPLILEMAVHTFDQARYITGLDPVSVYCNEYNSSTSWYDGNASASCIFEMENNVIFTYNGSWTAKGNLTSWESEWRVNCNKGAAYWDGFNEPWYEIIDESEKNEAFPTKYNRSTIESPTIMEEHAGCINEMIDSLINGKKAQTDVSDNIKSLAMVMGSIMSAESHKKIYIKDIL
ncbi:oxidoreductase [Vallitalea longa]|uniref:Oxidoreductase n=1 Tax=Vallitalea longa TaxID=2936439 RepID=A0A9W5YCS2_9FIRM|nr:Gfo/Idh/MocA family oxidoreductase [Vallitalea longa]GKX30689.1 oxidoreductase [Vallitalea longa]